MLDKTSKDDLFVTYYGQWITVYKEGAIRNVTMAKYHQTKKWLEKLVPELKIGDLNRITYGEFYKLNFKNLVTKRN